MIREWVVSSSLYNYPTTCREPERLSGKMWDDIPIKEFACKVGLMVLYSRERDRHKHRDGDGDGDGDRDRDCH